MPYSSNQQLPKEVRDALPKNAQDIFRNAFNAAMRSGKPETTAFKIAWGAVKQKYRQIGGKWMKKEYKTLVTPPLPSNSPPLVAENLAGGKKKRRKKKKKS